MAKFHGKTNLHLGEPAWATSVYDHEAHDYVIDVSDDDLKKFRAVAEGYGFVEDESPEPAAKQVRKSASAKADKDN
jgi:hypothetical protein